MAKPTVPIYNKDGIGSFWMWPDIYTGPTGTGKYVPNKDDAVLHWLTGWYRVADVDGDGLSTMVAWTPPQSVDQTSDLLFGTIPGYASESSRVYYDKSVTPHVLAIDKRMRSYGSEATYVKIFKGTDLTDETGIIIGYMVDSTGHIGSENIPLELIAIDNVNNVSIKSPKVAYTSHDLVDGDLVTVVSYSESGVVAYQKMLIKDTSFVRGASADTRFITGISIKSPFLDTSKENTFSLPMYTNVDSVSMIGVIEYSDGTSREQVINLGIGGKMRLLGFENFVATVVGQKIPLVLTYYLDSTEATYDAQAGDPVQKHISMQYWAEVTAVDGASMVKLFMVPSWVDENVGWKLDYWLYSLDRKNYYYVTPYVTMGATSADFQPLLYGTRQELSVVIDLSKVDSRFRPIRHPQTFAITLVGPGLDKADPWYLRYSPGQTPAYGNGISAKFKFGSVDNWGVKVDCGAASQAAWLDALYFRTQPLFYPDVETQGLTPTHFVVVVASDVEVEFPISQWNSELAVKSGGSEGEGIHIRWIYRGSDNNDLYLGASPMVVRHVTDYTSGTGIG